MENNLTLSSPFISQCCVLRDFRGTKRSSGNDGQVTYTSLIRCSLIRSSSPHFTSHRFTDSRFINPVFESFLVHGTAASLLKLPLLNFWSTMVKRGAVKTNCFIDDQCLKIDKKETRELPFDRFLTEIYDIQPFKCRSINRSRPTRYSPWIVTQHLTLAPYVTN